MARSKQTARKSTSAARMTPATSMPPASSVIPAKRKFYKDSVVTIFVDKSKRPFYLHLDLLCDASPFFKAEFAGNFQEASEKTMQLPDVRESTFELFADWLYYQRYKMLLTKDDDDNDDQEADDEEVEDDNESDKDENRYMQAFRLFVFADKYNVCKLKSNVINAVLEDFRGPEDSLPMTAVTYAYKHTAQGSGLRRLLADSYVCADFGSEIPKTQAYLQKQSDFAVDIIFSFAKEFKTCKRDAFKHKTPEDYEDKNPGHENGHSDAK